MALSRVAFSLAHLLLPEASIETLLGERLIRESIEVNKRKKSFRWSGTCGPTWPDVGAAERG